jgi:hypothetical protein
VSPVPLSHNRGLAPIFRLPFANGGLEFKPMIGFHPGNDSQPIPPTPANASDAVGGVQSG